jgi:hypothetical protein
MRPAPSRSVGQEGFLAAVPLHGYSTPEANSDSPWLSRSGHLLQLKHCYRVLLNVRVDPVSYVSYYILNLEDLISVKLYCPRDYAIYSLT